LIIRQIQQILSFFLKYIFVYLEKNYIPKRSYYHEKEIEPAAQGARTCIIAQAEGVSSILTISEVS
jgi:hypothetical protein